MCRNFGLQSKEDKHVVDSGERKLVIHQQDGRLRNLLKKTYLKRWINPLDVNRNEVDSDYRRSGSMDLARHVLIISHQCFLLLQH